VETKTPTRLGCPWNKLKHQKFISKWTIPLTHKPQYWRTTDIINMHSWQQNAKNWRAATTQKVKRKNNPINKSWHQSSTLINMKLRQMDRWSIVDLISCYRFKMFFFSRLKKSSIKCNSLFFYNVNRIFSKMKSYAAAKQEKCYFLNTNNYFYL